MHSIIREYVATHPGATKDRIYDEVVSRMVRSGQMQAHDFDELLSQVAEEVRQPVKKDLFENEPPDLFGTHEVSRWYLKETELAISDAAESGKEDAAADKIRAFIEKHLGEHPGEESVHYSDLFEYFVYTIKDKPRRPLAEWLLDYFYKTEGGTYRLPVSEEEGRAKAEGRTKGTNRRVKRYLAWLEQGVAIPDKERPNDATLAEWIPSSGMNPFQHTKQFPGGRHHPFHFALVRGSAHPAGIDKAVIVFNQFLKASVQFGIIQIRLYDPCFQIVDRLDLRDPVIVLKHVDETFGKGSLILGIHKLNKRQS